VETDLREYYSNLLIRQYHSKRKARDTILWAVDHKIKIYGLAKQLAAAFEIEVAIGRQLDIVGKYVNVLRLFDGGAANLNDDDFRFFIRWKIISNLSLDNMASFHEAVNSVFGGAVLLENNRDMSISYWLRQPLSSTIISLLETNKNLMPAPMGVAVSYIVDSHSGKIFGFNDFRKNTVTIIVDLDTVGFSYFNDDSSTDFVEGDFLEIDEIIY
jgi:hypothetical protein